MATETITMAAPTAIPALTCPRDGITTRLTCVQCWTPICPSCLVRTAVGLKCPVCAPGPTVFSVRRRGRGWMAWAAVAVTSAILTVAAASSVAGGGASAPEPVGSAVAAASASPVIGHEASVGPFAVTVSRFECQPPPAGARLTSCRSELSVRNDGVQARPFPNTLQAVTDGVRFFPASPAPEAPISEVPLNPGETVSGAVVFDVPAGLHPTALHLRASATAAAVRMPLRP